MERRSGPSFVLHDPTAPLREAAVAAVRECLTGMGVESAGPAVATPPEGMGDMAFPCFQYAKPPDKGPQDAAAQLAVALRSARVRAGEVIRGALAGGPGTPGGMEDEDTPPRDDGDVPASGLFSVEASGPFVNVTFRSEVLLRLLLRAVGETGAAYGSSPATGKKLILEHTSANPNGPLHVGRTRNPVTGDTLARVLRRAGWDVLTQYWVNDMGKQLAILSWGMNNLGPGDVEPPEKGYEGKADHVFVRYYQKANALVEEDPAVAESVAELLRRNEAQDRASIGRVKRSCRRVLDGMTESLKRLGIGVDEFVWESDSLLDGSVDEVLEMLGARPETRRDDGSCYIDMEPFGVRGKNTRWSFTRSDGTSLYTTRDVAYHRWKLGRCDRAVNVLGEDHRLQARQLAVALRLTGIPPDRLPEVVFLSFVSLPEGKMSTRRNRVVFLDQLLDEAVERAALEVRTRRPGLDAGEAAAIAEAVGTGAVRYNIVRIQNEKKIVFRWEDALNFEGQSAPFIQYSHARACSILRKAGLPVGTADLLAPAPDATRGPGVLDHPSEDALVRQLAAFPHIVSGCADSLRVHPLAIYAHSLAAAFNVFYRDCPVLNAGDGALRSARLTLSALAAGVLRNALDTLGIPAPERM